MKVHANLDIIRKQAKPTKIIIEEPEKKPCVTENILNAK